MKEEKTTINRKGNARQTKCKIKKKTEDENMRERNKD